MTANVAATTTRYTDGRHVRIEHTGRAVALSVQGDPTHTVEYPTVREATWAFDFLQAVRHRVPTPDDFHPHGGTP